MSRTKARFSKLLDSIAKLSNFRASAWGLFNQVGLSRKRCSPWENHWAYSSSVAILGRELCQLPWPQNYLHRPRWTNCQLLPANVSFGFESELSFMAKNWTAGTWSICYLSSRSIVWPSLPVDVFKPLSRSNVSGQRAGGPSSFSRWPM